MAKKDATAVVAPETGSSSKTVKEEKNVKKDDAYEAGRKGRQELGAMIFILYLMILAGSITASYYDMIPVHPVERSSIKIFMDWAEYFGEWMIIPFILSFLYYFVIFGIQEYMTYPKENPRKPMELRNPLALWSLFLALFSFAGSVRTVPVVIKILQTKGLHHMICGDTREDWIKENPAGMWTLLFILSKIPELVDTLFIVLKKQPVITLHWYHHITVMIYCWHAWACYGLNGLIFAAMNLTVHASMYFFYALTALGYRPTKYAQSVTIGQIIQMVVGTGVSIYVFVHETYVVPKKFTWSLARPDWVNDPSLAKPDGECIVNTSNTILGLLMYFSYLVLFLWFYYRAYILKQKVE